MSLTWFMVQPLAMAIVGPHILVSNLGHWRVVRFIGVLLTGVTVSIPLFLKKRSECSFRLFYIPQFDPLLCCCATGPVLRVAALFRTVKAAMGRAPLH